MTDVFPHIEAAARALCEADPLAPDPDAAVMVDMHTVRAWESRVPMVEAVLHAAGWPASDSEIEVPIHVVGIDGTEIKLTPRMACELIARIPNFRVLGLTLDEIRALREFWKENRS